METVKKINNINIYTEDFEFKRGSISFDSKIRNIEIMGDEDENLDYLLPGLIDIHTHGNSGIDFSETNGEAFYRLSRYYAENGITSFLGTTSTIPLEQLKVVCGRAGEYIAGLKGENKDQSAASECLGEIPGAKMLGINLEGPFISPFKCGAQDTRYILDAVGGYETFLELNELSKENVKLITIAPEIRGGMELIEKISGRVKVSVGHTACGYDAASRAFLLGASQLTHTFNGMMPITAREPGPIIAAAEADNAYAELICDGLHVSPSNVRMLFGLFGAERIILISDSLSCCGMPDGDFRLGEQLIRMKDGLGYLSDGTLAGSAHNLFFMLKQAVSFGIPKEKAIRTATYNPAGQLGMLDSIGSLSVGKAADMIVCSKKFDLIESYVNGIRCFKAK